MSFATTAATTADFSLAQTVCAQEDYEDDDSEDDTSSEGHQDMPIYPPGTKMTTLMIRNIPVMYTQDMLQLEWPNNGTYDFLYLPRRCAGQTNLSYAFINFNSETHALAFKAAWQKQRLTQFRARKSVNISFADVQGLQANLRQLKKKRVRRIEMRQCQPIVIMNGFSVALADALATLAK